MYTLLCQHDHDLYIREVSNHLFEHSWIRFKMAGIGSGREQNIEARLVEAREILKLKVPADESVNDEARKKTFKNCDSKDTRCFVVLEGFGDRTHFWERQRTYGQRKLENEECTYKKGRHAEAYVLARLDLYIFMQEEREKEEREKEEREKEERKKKEATEEKATEEKATEERATEEKATEEKATEEKATEEKATEEEIVEGMRNMAIKKKVIIYLTREPCNSIDKKYPNSKSCLKRILEFLNVYDDIEIEINYVWPYQPRSHTIQGEPGKYSIDVTTKEYAKVKSQVRIEQIKSTPIMMNTITGKLAEIEKKR